MPRILYIASGNPGKLRDFAAIGEEFGEGFLFEPLPGLDAIPAPQEDGETFEENARNKAAEYSLYARGQIVLADDSGLEVDALHGAPGVRSARYAADTDFTPPHETSSNFSADECNNLLLLKGLQEVPADQRTARYRCVLAAACDGQCFALGRGAVEGTILAKPRGNGGFGYDPLFYLPNLGCTMAEIDLKAKLEVSHRGNALRDLLRVLKSLDQFS